MNKVLQVVAPPEAFFWATHNGVELELMFLSKGQHYGGEVKFSEVSTVTKFMHAALADLCLRHLWVIYPGRHTFPLHERTRCGC